MRKTERLTESYRQVCACQTMIRGPGFIDSDVFRIFLPDYNYNYTDYNYKSTFCNQCRVHEAFLKEFLIEGYIGLKVKPILP